MQDRKTKVYNCIFAEYMKCKIAQVEYHFLGKIGNAKVF